MRAKVKEAFPVERPLTEHDRDARDLQILELVDALVPWSEIAWITGVSAQQIETLVVESLEGEP